MCCVLPISDNKKDHDHRQTIDYFSSTVSDSHGQPGFRRIYLLRPILFRPITSRDLYSHYQKFVAFLREYEACDRLVCCVHILA